jgi:hypothetical protein
VFRGRRAQHSARIVQQHRARAAGPDIDSEKFRRHRPGFLSLLTKTLIREIVFFTEREPKHRVRAESKSCANGL